MRQQEIPVHGAEQPEAGGRITGQNARYSKDSRDCQVS